jgi:transcriptional regulator with XRE-family HTH domain
MSQAELGPALGWSHRTAVRWEQGGALPTGTALAKLAALLAPVDLDLASDVAAQAGETLESLGLVARPAPEPVAAAPESPVPAPHVAVAPRLPVDVLADAVVCAAADVTDLLPRALRPILHAALARSRALGLTLEELEEALRVRVEAKPVAGKAAERPRVRVESVEASDDAPGASQPRGRRSRAR